MTSRERADAVLREYYGPNYSSTEFSGKIAAAIDAAVAEERKACIKILETHMESSDNCGSKFVGNRLHCIAREIERGDHIQPPKPRYEVREFTATKNNKGPILMWLVRDLVGHGWCGCFDDDRLATAECDRMNKEAAK